MDTNKPGKYQDNFDFFDRPVPIDPFNKNTNGERAYKRLERIAGAVFLLTNHIAHDTLKDAVRESVVVALRQLLEAQAEMRNDSSQRMTDLFSTLRRTTSLIRLLVLSGSISPQNADVIVGACGDLAGYLSAAARSPFSESRQFSKEDFFVPADVLKGQIKDKKDMGVTDASNAVAAGANDSSSERRAVILGILRKDVHLSIKDVSMHLPEFSEKTIQRELLSLIANGSVRKTGSRRWSKYALSDAAAVGKAGDH